MTDTRTPEQRRRIMQSVGTKDTKPEIVLRRLLHRAGYRYRLHRRELPGSPDIVFPGRRKVVFVHGCFWHGHGCGKGKLPKSRLDYWGPKILRNQERDRQSEQVLREQGWDVLTVWQCEMREPEARMERVKAFLGKPKNRSTFDR